MPSGLPIVALVAQPVHPQILPAGPAFFRGSLAREVGSRRVYERVHLQKHPMFPLFAGKSELSGFRRYVHTLAYIPRPPASTDIFYLFFHPVSPITSLSS